MLNNPEQQPGAKNRSLIRIALRWVEHAFALFGALVALCWLTIDYSVVVSPSMSPALQGTDNVNGDHVITEKISLQFRKPRRWEVITFISRSGDRLMKRVVALPGESVQMVVPGELLVDGQSVEPPPSVDRKYIRYGNLVDGKPVPCGDGYYVLGDDTKDSDDSRFNGPVLPNQIVGRAWLIVAPSKRRGWVK